jgi:hypothetical protein
MKLAWQLLVYTTLPVLKFNRNSFSTSASIFYALRAKMTGLMINLYFFL